MNPIDRNDVPTARDCERQPLWFGCLLAFGDLVITVTSLEKLCADQTAGVGLLVGNHLDALVGSLRSPLAKMPLQHGERDVPALFDVKKRGKRAALQSALRLRNAFAQLPLPRSKRIVLSSQSIRNLIIAGNRPISYLPSDQPNIYLGYRALLSAFGYYQCAIADRKGAGAATLGIFPGSRIAEKNLSIDTIRRIIRVAEACAIEPRVMLLAGERFDLEASDLPHLIIERNFSAMIEAVGSSDLVASADSLPAHLAERQGLPVFVFSPVQNDYYMPLSSFEAGHWSLFDPAHPGWGAFRRFLASSN